MPKPGPRVVMTAKQKAAKKRVQKREWYLRKKTREEETVEATPFVDWLLEQDRCGWSIRLTHTQIRYIERLLKRRADGEPDGPLNVHSVDDVLVALDQPWILHCLYPETGVKKHEPDAAAAERQALLDFVREP